GGVALLPSQVIQRMIEAMTDSLNQNGVGGVRGLALACLAMLPLAACTTGPGEHGSHPVYPRNLTQQDTLNIQESHDVRRSTFTSPWDQVFGSSRRWPHGSYGSDVEPIEIDETLTLALNDFVNDHGELFRAGRFFAAERPDVLVLAQL